MWGVVMRGSGMSPGSKEQAACPPGPGAQGWGRPVLPGEGAAELTLPVPLGLWHLRPGSHACPCLSLSLTQHPQSPQAPTSGKEDFLLALSTVRL